MLNFVPFLIHVKRVEKGRKGSTVLDTSFARGLLSGWYFSYFALDFFIIIEISQNL